MLAGPQDCRDLMLSSPVILYDHPEIAAESAGDLFDATEIDEILTLRTLTLTDAEKRQARATDSRAAELMDRLDDMPPEMLDRMHGAIRYLRSAPGGGAALGGGGGAPYPFASAGLPRPRAGDGIDWPAPRGHRPALGAVVGSGRGRLGVPGDRPASSSAASGSRAAAGC